MTESVTFLRPDTPNASLGGQALATAEKYVGTQLAHVNRFVVESSGSNALAADVYTLLPATNAAGLGVWIVGANPIGLAAGSNVIGSVGAATSGGATPYKYVSAANTNAANVKASAGQLYGLSFGNNSTNVAYLKIYDKASTPVLASDVPKLVYIIPANSGGAGGRDSFPVGVVFANGISHAITRGLADNDTTATAASEIVVGLIYK